MVSTSTTNVTTVGAATTTVATMTSVADASVAACRRDRSSESTSEAIDPNKCCMCFVSYEDDVLEGAGAVWISCKCGRWLHEDCVEDVVTDSTGEERFCFFCIDKYTIRL